MRHECRRTAHSGDAISRHSIFIADLFGRSTLPLGLYRYRHWVRQI